MRFETRRTMGALFFAAVLLSASALPAFADDGAKEMEDPFAKATELKDEAKDFFNQAGDTDLSPRERKKNRKEAYTRLVKARIMLDDWLELHPDDAERLDDLYVDIAGMMYWIRKEATLNELPPYPPPRPGENKPGKEDEPEDEPPEDVPVEPKGPTAAEVLERIRQYEQKFPGDIPGLHQRYTAFLAQFPDTSTPEYEAAANRLSELDQRLKDVYRIVRDDDPDALENVDNAELLRLIEQLTTDLEKGSQPVRVRAARFLGGLGSGEAANPLIGVLKREKDGPVFDAAAESLGRIGGRRVCAKLKKIKPSSSLAATVVDILIQSVERGGVSARIAGETLAEYVAERNEEEQHRAVEALHKAGKPGALGLSMAVEMAPVEKKADYIKHLGKMADPRTAGYLARFLKVNPRGARVLQQAAARQAILQIGGPGVRYLIPNLDDERYAVWTAELLRQITGAKLKNDKRRTWERYWRKHRRELEGK